ncbi:MAG: alpha-amylase family glycosyl hydrolase [Prevotella sp.]|uniref:alpha-amylase family glycosyl hydrolase n=1 Tax=Prevotella sp. TaxID=59823 RepID=UPI002A24F416|nr:alpha-amylase family glycosyl hydrolase [Prevotella sp.]MDD7319304.1 alpha-amylase family glycosyl hydrolase [Prevotellaceae bacterium]MDY4020866.1 alpha-amylase family glycosyl hydrolase [Prevotella sp.]
MKHIAKTFVAIVLAVFCSQNVAAQGWPENYGGVMLQGFYWDSFSQSKWTKLESQADDLAATFSLIWIPQSGKCLEQHNVMGYTPYYYFNQNSSFGTEQELRSMIQTFKSKGLGTVADVVVNHHNTTGWWTFPAEEYRGTTYQFQTTDIVNNDDYDSNTKQYKTREQAEKDGVTLSSNADEGEDWDGMRDLDHKSANVQKIVMAYVKFLKDDLGYSGFRYDMVKGFGGEHVADYNDAAGIEFSVGECWDGNSVIKNWIDATGKKSAAFDFQFRYNVRDAINANDWRRLNSTNNLMHDPAYNRYAVTFVENHDTEKRAGAEQDPIRRDTLAANAYLIAMPGTPCVFYTHWLAYKSEIKAMVDARRAAGVTNTSSFLNLKSEAGCHANAIKVGGVSRMVVAVGNNAASFTPSGAYTLALSGYHYRYFLAKSLETAWADRSSGVYDDAFKVRLTAVSQSDGAQIVFTTDGSTPTAGSRKVASGTEIDIEESCTLKVGMLISGSVSGVIERSYTINKHTFEPKTVTVYCRVDEGVPGWTSMNYWTWSDFGHAPANTSWPGDRITATKQADGKTWYYKDFTLTSEDDYVNFVFSNGSGLPQSVNVENVKTTKFFVIRNEKDTQGHYLVDDVSATSAVEGVIDNADNRPLPLTIYTIDGRLIRRLPAGTPEGDALNGLPRGMYVVNGKKMAR